MRCNPTEHPLLCAEAPFLSKDEREKMVEHLFEGFASPAVFLAKNPVLSSFALGRQTSLVVDMGHSGTVGKALLSAVQHSLCCLVCCQSLSAHRALVFSVFRRPCSFST